MLLGLGFEENRELKNKFGNLVEKHNQSKKKDFKTKCSLSPWLWLSVIVVIIVSPIRRLVFAVFAL